MAVQKRSSACQFIALERNIGKLIQRLRLIWLQRQRFAQPFFRLHIVTLHARADAGICVSVFRRGVEGILERRREIFHRLLLALALA